MGKQIKKIILFQKQFFKNRRNKIIFTIIIFELIFLIILFYRISKEKMNEIEIFYLNKVYYINKQVDDLKHFYMLKNSLGRITDLTSQPSWLANKPEYTINSDGLNELRDYQIKKQDDVFRIITLGDSFTFGLFVDTKYSWPKQLEDLLNTTCKKERRFEIINLGLGGYDLRYAAQIYKEKGKKYDADLILWLVKDSSFHLINEKLLPLVRYYEQKMEKSDYLNSKSPEWINVWKKVKKEYYKDLDDVNPSEYQEKSLYIVGDDFEKQIVVINLPEYSADKQNKDIIKKFTQSRKLTYFYDKLPNIIKNKEIFPESHPDIKGYRSISTALLEYLLEQNIIKC